MTLNQTGRDTPAWLHDVGGLSRLGCALRAVADEKVHADLRPALTALSDDEVVGGVGDESQSPTESRIRGRCPISAPVVADEHDEFPGQSCSRDVHTSAAVAIRVTDGVGDSLGDSEADRVLRLSGDAR